MLKTSFTPIFSTPLHKPLTPKLISTAITKAFTHPPPTVHQNASPNITTTTYQQPPPTSAYVHLPFCRKRCHYCDFPIVALGSSTNEDDPRISNYIQLLCREINATKSQFNLHQPQPQPQPPLETVFFGGGTPSLVPPRLVEVVLDTLRLKFGLSSDAEISMEMDPGTFDGEKLKGFMGLGVNRVSLGVQAFQDEMLKSCGRAHGVKEVYEAIEIVGDCGVENWSMDLISSLPHQSLDMWEESLKLTVEAKPNHVSVYDLQVEDGTKFGNLYKPGEFPLPSETKSADFYRMASSTLSTAGYNHYEISSYSKDGYECEHNQTYWKNNPFYAFGLGSASYLNGLRFSRPKSMKLYTGYVQNLENNLITCYGSNGMETKDLATDVVMLSLRTSRGLDLKGFRESFGFSVVYALCKAYKDYVESGHVVCLDEQRRSISSDEFNGLVLNEDEMEKRVVYIRLSDPHGFLLSNELISIAFTVIAP